LCAVAVVTGSAVAKKPSRTRTFTTGGFAVTCTSTGQVCSPPEKLTIAIPRRGMIREITYTTSPAHCSAVLVRILLSGRLVGKTDKLNPGQRSQTLNAHIFLHKGSTTLSFQAQGFTGGCNAGRLASWGGKVTVKVRLVRH
jgi:photosystem II stability/assembly factor-like uncharacterized protein